MQRRKTRQIAQPRIWPDRSKPRLRNQQHGIYESLFFRTNDPTSGWLIPENSGEASYEVVILQYTGRASVKLVIPSLGAVADLTITSSAISVAHEVDLLNSTLPLAHQLYEVMTHCWRHMEEHWHGYGHVDVVAGHSSMALRSFGGSRHLSQTKTSLGDRDVLSDDHNLAGREMRSVGHTAGRSPWPGTRTYQVRAHPYSAGGHPVCPGTNSSSRSYYR